MQEAGEENSGIAWDDPKEATAAANATATSPKTGGAEAPPTTGGR